MTPETVLDALARADLARLGFRADDAADCRRVIATLPCHPERLSRVAELAGQLRARIGCFFDDDLPVREDAGMTTFEEGIVTLLALVAVAEHVHDAQVARGLSSDLARASLADLGQQVHIFRTVFGCFGFVARAWCVANFTGRHLWLGRLQFTLERSDDGTPFVGVHIPETGPLTPAAVDASLAAAREVIPRLRPHHPVDEFRLESWLLDPLIIAGLDPRSNLARFVSRFEILDPGEPSHRSAYFFVFHKEWALQPIDLSALPSTTSLQRAVLDVPLDSLSVPIGRLIEQPSSPLLDSDGSGRNT